MYLRQGAHSGLLQEQPRVQTLEAFITDADSPGGAVAMSTAELWTGFSNVHMVDSPALLLSLFPFLDPAELRGTEKPKENKESQWDVTVPILSSLCL